MQSASDTLDGRYIVTAIDGKAPVIDIAGFQPTITIDGTRVHFQSQCIYADWTIERDGSRISAKPFYKPGSAMCARGLAPGETAIQDAFTGLRTLAPTPSGGLHAEGGGHTLELRRGPPEGTASLLGSWRVESIDGQRPRTSVMLEGDANRLWWEPACAAQVRFYTVEGSRFHAPPSDNAGREVCEIGFPMELTQTWGVAEAADTITRLDGGKVRLAGGGRSVVLTPR